MNRKFSSEDELLVAFYMEANEPSLQLLEQWVALYPHYEKELRDFTVAWSIDQWMSLGWENRVDELDQIEVDESRIKALIQQALKGATPTITTRGPIKSLVGEVEGAGLSLDQFAKSLSLNQTILAKLDRRLIEYFSIPLYLIEIVSEILNREVISISKYLAGSPILPRAARFKSRGKLLEPRQENFFNTIRNDEDLDETHRESWLRFEKL